MSVIAILLVAAPLVLAPPAAAECDFVRGKNRTSISRTGIGSDDDGRSPVITYTHSQDNVCRTATIVGRLRYSENDDDIIEMPFGAYASFRERSADDDRELSISRADNGGVARVYRRNGSVLPFDADARHWLAQLMPSVLMEAGINIGPRVARWRAQGGTDNVLAKIGTMHSSGSKRSHYETFMASAQLSDGDFDKLIRHAGRNIQSSGDLRSILEKAAPTNGGVRSGSALEDAITHMASSGDKAAVLSKYGRTTDREMLLSVMRLARTIQSSGDKAELLVHLAPRYLQDADRALQTAFYQAAETIPSSGDLSRVLKRAVPYAASSSQHALRLIGATTHIASSGDRSSVLIALAESGAVKPAEVREAFLEAAAAVPSSGDRGRVLQAVVRY